VLIPIKLIGGYVNPGISSQKPIVLSRFTTTSHHHVGKDSNISLTILPVFSAALNVSPRISMLPITGYQGKDNDPLVADQIELNYHDHPPVVFAHLIVPLDLQLIGNATACFLIAVGRPLGTDSIK
jgi:hypothetical protein